MMILLLFYWTASNSRRKWHKFGTEYYIFLKQVPKLSCFFFLQNKFSDLYPNLVLYWFPAIKSALLKIIYIYLIFRMPLPYFQDKWIIAHFNGTSNIHVPNISFWLLSPMWKLFILSSQHPCFYKLYWNFYFIDDYGKIRNIVEHSVWHIYDAVPFLSSYFL